MSLNTARRFSRCALALVVLVVSWPTAAVAQAVVDTSESGLVAYAQRAWNTAGRKAVTEASGVRWDSAGGWALDANWSGKDDAGAHAYFVEPQMRGMLALAAALGNVAML